LIGAPAKRLLVCGGTRSVVISPQGGRVVAQITGGRRGSSVTVDECRGGHWGPDTKLVLRSRRGIARLPIDTSAAGDYRIRATRLPSVYLRVGVGEIVDVQVRFNVRNINRSMVPCQSDGGGYTVVGHLVAPRTVLNAPDPAVTLYIHGFGFGEFFWHFSAVPGYDYATGQAVAGHASVVVDRLGYGASGRPPGAQTCLGAQADITHQIIGELRTGAYVIAAGVAPIFRRIALAGHSIGGQIVQIEAYSFSDVDALLVISYADLSSPLALSEFGKTALVCLTGGQAAGPGASGGYAYFGQSPADFGAAMFYNISDSVKAAATALRTRDPCGDSASVPQALVADKLGLGKITVPVLVVCAANDALFPPADCLQQRGLFTGSRDASDTLLDNTGHALTLERTKDTFRGRVSAWLAQRGF
jgi:pimeloyl-ACP methyl ester carboxylesterase